MELKFRMVPSQPFMSASIIAAVKLNPYRCEKSIRKEILEIESHASFRNLALLLFLNLYSLEKELDQLSLKTCCRENNGA